MPPVTIFINNQTLMRRSKELTNYEIIPINYELRNERDDSGLLEKIQAYDTCIMLLKSCWVIAADQSISQIMDNLATAIESNDALLVTQLSEIAGRGIIDDANASKIMLIRKHIGQAA